MVNWKGDMAKIILPSRFMCTIHNGCGIGRCGGTVPLDQEHEQLKEECIQRYFLGKEFLIHPSCYTNGMLSSLLQLYVDRRDIFGTATICPFTEYPNQYNIALVINEKRYNYWGYSDGVYADSAYSRGAKEGDLDLREIIDPLIYGYEETK